MSSLQESQNHHPDIAPFRIDVPLHNLLQKPEPAHSLLPPRLHGETQQLPEPVFPQQPELLTDDWLPQDVHGGPDEPYKRPWPASKVYRALRGWMFPYFNSRLLPGDFHPIIAYLFTEWKCNLDCHYCWAFDNHVKGMTEEVARRSID